MEELQKYMKLAIKEAKKGALRDEVPVGAVAVLGGKVIARAFNHKEKRLDATAHAEIELLKKCAKKLGNWWLENVDVYVTLEPCVMCAGAMVNARIRHLYFGAYDSKGGAAGSLYNVTEDARLNHLVPTTGGILERECGELLSEFFKNKRKNGGNK